VAEAPGITTRTFSRRLLLSGLTSVVAIRQADVVFAMQNAGESANNSGIEAVPTKVCVRVIARDGKFLGDDIGGASITIRDAQTRELLAKGTTSGGSGLNGPGGVMCTSLRRGEPLPTTDASSYTADLKLDRPRRIEVTAYGPLGVPGSANTVSATQWVYPGKDIVDGVGFLLELPGLIVQIVSPPANDIAKSSSELRIQAHVAMMCGCPIDYKSDESNAVCPELPDDEQPWLPNEFEVAAVISGASGAPTAIPLQFVGSATTPGQFSGKWEQPLPGTHDVTVYAYQKTTGNTGVDTTTILIPG
jgi:hypothetical protein